MPYLSFHDAQSVQNAVLRCPFDRCNARLIRLLPSLYETRTVLDQAPEMNRDSTHFLRVGDMWDFDNIGVLKAVDMNQAAGPLARVERLLICSECDQGPLGFAGYTDADERDVRRLVAYLSCESVLYEVME